MEQSGRESIVGYQAGTESRFFQIPDDLQVALREAIYKIVTTRLVQLLCSFEKLQPVHVNFSKFLNFITWKFAAQNSQ